MCSSDLFVRRPLFAIAPVLRRDLPVSIRVPLPLRKARELLVAVYLKPELEDDTAIVEPLRFHLVDLFVGSAPLPLRGKALDPLHQDPSIPAPVVNTDMSGFGKGVPEPPEIVVRLLPVVGRSGGRDLISSWIQPLGKAFNAAALPRRIQTFENNYSDRKSVV